LVEQTVTAASNPGLANKLIEQALETTTPEKEPIKIKPPLNNLVDLPGGYYSPDGEVIRTAEVRELTGKDEEAISRHNHIGKALMSVISRGTVKVGDIPATDEILDKMLSADRDALLLGIYRATFGNDAELNSFCEGCGTLKTVVVDTAEDIKVKTLQDPLEDRVFIVSGKKEYKVTLPNGKAQKELATADSDKNLAELDTTLLEYCVLEINGQQVLGRNQILAMGVTDRKKVLTEIINRNPGPKFDDVKATCPDCDGEVVVPISFGALFQF
jgi:hypothetical protein